MSSRNRVVGLRLLLVCALCACLPESDKQDAEPSSDADTPDSAPVESGPPDANIPTDSAVAMDAAVPDDECLRVPCLNGICKDLVSGFSCSCAAGWTGTLCDVDIKDCAANPCGHGVCTDRIAAHTCACDPGWEGTECDVDTDDCAPDPCAQGTCVDAVNGFACNCESGWTGTRCDVHADDCTPDPCLHGVCSDEAADFSCSCEAGWTGTICNVDIDDCAANPCGHGDCTDLVDAYRCACDPGWEGTDCDVDTDDCAPDPCAQGTCVDAVNGFACNCESGWTGTLCDLNADDCTSSPCLHGVCSDEGAAFSCSCEAGWTGTICNVNIDDCAANPCDHGDCTDLVHAYSCACDSGWDGTDCDVDANDCAANPCVHGACVDAVNGFACNCESGWTGTLCDGSADDCTPDPCLHGVCSDEGAAFSCSCESGWTGTICNVDIDECTPNPCDHGACTGLVNTYSCACDSGWEGTDCDVNSDDCAANPCVHGACVDAVNGFACNCASGWTGRLCDVDTVDDCATDPCIHGTCIDLQSAFHCTCESPWAGPTCSTQIAGSCLQILEAGQSTGDGSYTIDLDDTGPLAPLVVHCDMTTDGGGYTFYEVTGGVSTNRFDQPNSCQTLGLELLVPRTKAHYESFMALYAASSRTTVSGIYGTVAGNYSGCTMNSFALNKCANWHAIDDGPWFLRSAPYGEPNGDYEPGCWLIAGGNPIAGGFNDAGCNGSTGSSYVCSTNDKKLTCPAVLPGAETAESGWASWAAGNDGNTGNVGTCPDRTVASGDPPRRVCRPGGVWSMVTNPCIPLTCADGVNGGCGDAAFVTCTDAAPAPRICADIDECADGNNGGCGTLACDNAYGAPQSCVVARPSCLEHLKAGVVTSGTYALDPDGVGGTPWYWAYCDMETDGGGWTLVMNIAPRDGNSVGHNNQAFWTGDAEYGSIEDVLSNDYKGPAAYLLSSSEIMIASAATGPAGAVTGWRTWPFATARVVDSMFTTGIVPGHNPDVCETGASVRINTGTTSAADDIIRRGSCLHSDVNPSDDTIRLTTIPANYSDNQMSGFAACIDCGGQGVDSYMGLDRAACNKSRCNHTEIEVGAARDADCRGDYCQNWQSSWGYASGLDWNSRIFVRGPLCGVISAGDETADSGWAQWPVGTSGDVSQGTCGDTAFEAAAAPTRSCESDGTWGPVVNPCIPKTCADGVNGDCGDPAYVTCTDVALAPRICADIDECADGNNGGCGTLACINTYAGSQTCMLAYPSCFEHLEAGLVTSGLYPLDPDGVGAAPWYWAYCDMETDGGGWTLVMNIAPRDGNSVGYNNQDFWTADAEYGSIKNVVSNDYKSPASYLISSSEIMIASAATGPAGAVTGWRTWPFTRSRTVDSMFTPGIVAVHRKDVCETGPSVRTNTGTTRAADDIIRQGTCLHSDVNPSASGEGDTTRLTTIPGNYTDNRMSGFASCVDCGAPWQGADAYMGLDRAACNGAGCDRTQLEVGEAPDSDCQGLYCWYWQDGGDWGHLTGLDWNSRIFVRGVVCDAIPADTENAESGWAHWPTGASGDVSLGTCSDTALEASAAPTRTCQGDATWGPVVNPCIPKTCADGVNGDCGDPAYVTCTDVALAPRICTDVDECADGNNGGCGTLACINTYAGPQTCMLPYPSCFDHLEAGLVTSGLYPLDPDGVGGTPWYWAYCDMETDGGGWTLVMNIAPRDGNSVGYNNQDFWTADAEYGSIEDVFSNDYKSAASYLISSSEIMIASAATGPAGAVTGWRTWPFTRSRTVDSMFTTGIVAVHATDACETGPSVRTNTGTTRAADDIIRQGTCLHSDVNPSANGEGDTTRLTTIPGDNTDNRMSGFASCIDCGTPWQGADAYMGLDRAACNNSGCDASQLEVGAAPDSDCKGNYCIYWESGDQWGNATGLDWNSRIFVRGVVCDAIPADTENAASGWAHWPTGTGGDVSMGTCSDSALETGAAPTRICQGDATWGPVVNPCIPKTCADGVNGDCGDPAYVDCVDDAPEPRRCIDIQECLVNNGGCVAPNDVCSEQYAAPPGCVDLRPSCHAYLDAGSLDDGLYEIDPDGSGPLTSFEVYCDMLNGGWTLLMKLSAGDFCYGSALWTNGAEYNPEELLDTDAPNGFDAKSRAFHELSDVMELQFVTQHASVATSFEAPSSPEVLMTTNDIDFLVYPDRTAWKDAFLQDRDAAPVFMRAGVPVTTPAGSCRTNPEATPSGCGKACMFCYQASNGSCCNCATSGDDVSSGVGNNAEFCGGGNGSTCSTGGHWSDNGNQTVIWGR